MSQQASRGRVAGKVALVTGAGSGIGRATSLMLAKEGATVICADLNFASVEETAGLLTAANACGWPCRLDVTQEPDWEEAIGCIIDQEKHLAILVNCAGIAFSAPITEMTLADWRRVMAVNLEGVFLGTKHAIRAMKLGSRNGSIINVSSVSGIKAQPAATVYCASKAAVIMLSKTAALECQRDGLPIRVNAVSPSGVKTAMWKTQPFFQELMAAEGGEEQAFQAMARAYPNSRFAFPEEIAQAILFLASDESLYITGTNLAIDNGDTA